MLETGQLAQGCQAGCKFASFRGFCQLCADSKCGTYIQLPQHYILGRRWKRCLQACMSQTNDKGCDVIFLAGKGRRCVSTFLAVQHVGCVYFCAITVA